MPDPVLDESVTPKDNEITPTGNSVVSDLSQFGIQDGLEMGPPPAGDGGGDGESGLGPGVGLLCTRLAKAVDPVAFMTSANAEGNKAKGNMDAAANNRNAEDGFFELAKGECDTISQELMNVAQKPGLQKQQYADLMHLASFASQYREVFTAIQDTQASKKALSDPGVRQAMVDKVEGALGKAELSWLMVSAETVAEVDGQVLQAIKDLRLFLAGWGSISEMSEHTNASPLMWANFLQTFERYRGMLNQYGQLEERGDATGTSRKMISDERGYTVKDEAKANQIAEDEGGYMVLALKSYGLTVKTTEAYITQIRSVLDDLKNGKFANQEECAAAFRERVGSGLASELYYDDLENISEGSWKTYLAEQEQKLMDEAVKKRAALGEEISSKGNKLANDLKEAKLEANTAENNTLKPGASTKDFKELGDKVYQGDRESVNAALNSESSSYKGDDAIVNGRVQSFEAQKAGEVFSNESFLDPKKEEQKPVMKMTAPQTAEERVHLGRSAVSKQQQAYLAMDQAGADEAYARAMEALQEMRAQVDELDAMMAEGTALAKEAEALHRQALENLGTARACFQKVGESHYGDIKLAIADGTAYIEQVDEKLRETEALSSVVDAHWQSLEKSLSKVKGDVLNYRPEVLKVPTIKASIWGDMKVTSSSYTKIAIEVDYPLPNMPILSVLGSLSAEYGVTGDVKQNSAQKAKGESKAPWTHAAVEVGVGLKAGIKLLELSIMLSGGLKVSVRGFEPDLTNIATRGMDELGAWAWASFWGTQNFATDMDAAVNTAKSSVGGIYDSFGTILEGLEPASAQSLKAAEYAGKQMEGVENTLQSSVHDILSNGGDAVIEGDSGALIEGWLPIGDIKKGLKELASVDAEGQSAAVAEEKSAVQGHLVKEGKAVSDKLDLNSENKNDPDVKIEASVSIAGKLSFGNKETAKFEGGYRRKWAFSDGEGRGFETKSSVIDEFSASGEFLNGKLKVEGAAQMSPDMPGGELVLGITVPPLPDDGVKSLTDNLRDFIMTAAGASMKDLVLGIMTEKFAKYLEPGTLKESPTMERTLKVEAAFVFSSFSPVTFDTVKSISVTDAVKSSFNANVVKASLEMGNKLTLDPTEYTKNLKLEDAQNQAMKQ